MKHSLNRGLVAAILSPWLATSESASFDEGLAAANRGDYATALEKWLPLANEGNASAKRNLGVMYSNGHGVPQDYAEAMKWYRKAAEQGNAFAQEDEQPRR